MDAGLHPEDEGDLLSMDDKDNSEVTERILSLVLEILYLLIEENYIIVKESGGHMKYSSATQRPPGKASAPSQRNNNNKKILDVTNKIIGLLMGEEWEYADHTDDLQKEADVVDGLKNNPRRLQAGGSRSFRPASIPVYIRKDGGIITVSPQEAPFKLLQDSSKPTLVTAATSPSEDDKLPEIYIHIPTDQLDYAPSLDNCPSYIQENISSREICKAVRDGRDKLNQADFRAVRVKEEPVDWEESDSVVQEEQNPHKCLSNGSDGNSPTYTEKAIDTNFIKEQYAGIKQEPASLAETHLQNSDVPGYPQIQGPNPQENGGFATANSQVQYVTTLVKKEHEDELMYEDGLIITSTDEAMSPVQSFQMTHIDEISYEYYSAHSSNVHRETDNSEKPFSCSECGKCFKYNNLLMHHAKSHQKKPLICCECGKQYSCKTEFEIHRRIHTGEKPFVCSECGKGFRRKSHMLRHRRIHGEKQPFPCPECTKCFHRLDVLNQHRKIHRANPPGSDMESLHGRAMDILSANNLDEIPSYEENVAFACPECGKCFHRLDLLDEHRKIHQVDSASSDMEDASNLDQSGSSKMDDLETQDLSEKVGFACSECGKCYDEMSQLERHQRVHSGEKPFSCTECGKSFRFEALLELHWGSHIATISCPECGKRFASQSLLNHHLKIHADTNDCICSECGKEFPSRSQLVDHYRTHTGEKPYMCPDCGKYFRRKAHVVRHRKIHSGNKPYSCLECGKCFESQEFLSRHAKMHRRKRPHSCSQCGKSYTKKSHLVRHQRTHNKVSPYTCSECGECFQYPALLRRHVKLHLGENNYECAVCSKNLGSEEALAQHQKTHTKEKSYICADCGKCFNFYSHFMRHQITHTGEKPYECPECGKRFTRDSHLVRHRRIHTGEGALEV
ncbi:uncharacterized protein PAF06_001215 [Gastrophryne carolinensis]